ncbi:hypothetical protein [Cytobacillus sp. IB215665]|uniref:hypothetical protein n=1 Tax=Cytobacillus sp. IB215665 TaxID=3097357 RepID=UPI002A15282E|nr:hypothetical protein [Cytobacillus sp. IB215665]MDX8367191.1 hypothetical protein [Cytobacillus sp. IB215665]
MKSIKLHMFERFLAVSISLLLTLLILSYIPLESKLDEWVDMGLFLFMLLSLGIFCFIQIHFKKWKRWGYTFSSDLGLKKIVIFKTNLLTPEGKKVFELHHKPHPLKHGLKLKKYEKKAVIQSLKNDLTKDFATLSKFCQEQDAYLVTITHKKMIAIWQQSSSSSFDIKETKEIRDPFVSPTLLQWIQLSISTSGRVAKRPKSKEWNTFVFHAIQGGESC